eukprot:TRINITY_DN932_c1_g1_i1.p1 TRINITY_DN932_c1_g1~~TRINITY_DN932_c1_g1_i1.p1  ORF type:complete len:595 (-),score=144.26 TRINITY_DN932_c1_g1_i1:130-1914(-)
MLCWWGIKSLRDCQLPNSKARETPEPDLLAVEGPSLHRPSLLNANQTAIREATRHAWAAYERHAWGADELRPLSRGGFDWFGSGLAFTLIDSLDTLWLMGLNAELQRAREFVMKEWPGKLSRFKGGVNTFETTIRVLGGLLGAFAATGDGAYLKAAALMGQQLLPALRTQSGVPYSDVELGSGAAYAPDGAPHSSLSEATSIQLEFKYLAALLRKHGGRRQRLMADEMQKLSDRAMEAIQQAGLRYHEAGNGLKLHAGLVPIYVSVKTGQFQQSSTVTLGARGDSYYEYLLKQYLQTDKREKHFLQRYLVAIEGVCGQLLRRSSTGLTFIGELLNGEVSSFSPKMDHLVCFLPGTLALGHMHDVDSKRLAESCPGLSHLDLAVALMETCVSMYKTTTGLAPEIVWFAESEGSADTYGEMTIKERDAFSLLRPETVESLFLLWRVTRDQRWRDAGWELFEALNRHARVELPEGDGFAVIENVNAEAVATAADLDAETPSGSAGAAAADARAEDAGAGVRDAAGGTKAAPPRQQRVLNIQRRDKMESFFLAETLKYLFLLFEDDERVLPLDEVVFNTEAHPFPLLRADGLGADATL